MILPSALVLAFQGQGTRPNPFAPPLATLHYAPDRTCDLTNVKLDLDVDYAGRTYTGHVVNTMSPLRSGLTEVRLMAGEILNISRVTVDGSTVQVRRDGEWLIVPVPSTQRGRALKIGVDYQAKNSQARPFGGEGGFHWIEPRSSGPATRVGFWTQGETGYNRRWVPTWDYPNDLATSETTTTVPADWTVVGNGVLVSDKLSADRKRRTFTWRMDQPHATYLLSLVGGPFDVKRDRWEGVDLWYVVPRGDAPYIDDTFAGTKDMLSFYSKILGVKYAWPKYAQDGMYDFGGGMENVSATTFGEGAITEKRAGFRTADSLLSHELGHQWFGDLVTCKDWGDTWLNESFATLLQTLYFEHSRGKNAYDQEIDDNMRSYFNEARRYKRPISTKLYASPDNMFDSHSYPKGGVVLHTLRRFLGDEAFFDGLNRYLTTHRHQPVESAQLRRAMTEASGINCEPFWAQWIEKPGHPVLDTTWSFADGKVALVVRQTQDTADGTPVYDIPAKVGLIGTDGTVTRVPIEISKTEETFSLPVGTEPKAVLLDPDHDFLREIPTLHWSEAELPTILRYAPNGVDRTEAMRRMLTGTPSDEAVRAVAEVVRQDRGAFPALSTLAPLGALARPELRPLFLELLNHPSVERQTEAVQALGRLPADPETTTRLRGLVNDQAPIPVVTAAIRVLADRDAKGNADVFRKALTIPSRRDRVKNVAQAALREAGG